MRKLMLLAGVAVLLAGQPAFSQGKGQGQGGGGGPHAEHGGGKGGGEGGGQGRGRGGDADGGKGRGGGQDRRAVRGDGGRGQDMRETRRAERPARPQATERRQARAEERAADRMRKGPPADIVEARNGPDSVRVDRTEPVRVKIAGRDRPLWRANLLPGCPPGLAKKNNGCLPPGQARKIGGDPLFGYAPWYGAAALNDWQYYDGYAYRLDPATGLVNSFLPLLGGGLWAGNPWPAGYDDYAVDPYYRRYYGYDDDFDYRYADGTLFAVDPQTQQIESIAALLAGDPWAVGQPMPVGYDLYNVPPAYRDRYYDSPSDWYRYSDGYVYRVDPTTQLVTSVISLLA